MSKMVVTRQPCGCVTQIVMGIVYLSLEDVTNALSRGDIIRLEEHDRLSFERCPEHERLPVEAD